MKVHFSRQAILDLPSSPTPENKLSGLLHRICVNGKVIFDLIYTNVCHKKLIFIS
jgi:hypothetical protein